MWDDNILTDAYHNCVTDFKELSFIWNISDQCLVMNRKNDVVRRAEISTLDKQSDVCTLNFLDPDPDQPDPDGLNFHLEELCPVVTAEFPQLTDLLYKNDEEDDITESDDTEESLDDDEMGWEFKHYQDGVSILFNNQLLEDKLQNYSENNRKRKHEDDDLVTGIKESKD